MATKFFLRSTTSDVNPDAAFNEFLASLSAGAGLATAVTNTVTTPTSIVVATDTAGGTKLEWISNPLNAVTIQSSTITFNFWMSENNMSANVGASVEVTRLKNDGTAYASGLDILSGSGSWASESEKGVELPVTTRAAQNWTATSAPTAAALVDGDRLGIRVGGFGVGGMATGFTFDFGYNGGTGAADGDSWVQFTETITEQTVLPGPAHRSPYQQLLAQARAYQPRKRFTFLDGLWRPDRRLVLA